MTNRKPIAMFYPYVSDGAITRVEKVMRDRWIGQGGLVSDFEHAVEQQLGVAHAIAVNSSSSALRLALSLCGIGPGDEIITTPMTCTLTNHPILEQFAIPVFADIQYETGNIDPTDVERRITERTKAIMCTHWGGYPADLSELNAVAKRHNLPVIEDASEAFGATYQGNAIGTISPCTAFSFQAIQIITTAEGGMLTTNDLNVARIARLQRWYGIDRDNRKPNHLGYYDFDVTTVGFGYHMTNIAAAMGLENLMTLAAQQSRRRAIAQRYREALCAVPGLSLLANQNDRESSHHFFTVHVDRQVDFCRKLNSEGIQVSIVHYRNDAYSVFGGLRHDLPNLEKFSSTYIALPVHMFLSDDDVEHIITTIKQGW